MSVTNHDKVSLRRLRNWSAESELKYSVRLLLEVPEGAGALESELPVSVEAAAVVWLGASWTLVCWAGVPVTVTLATAVEVW